MSRVSLSATSVQLYTSNCNVLYFQWDDDSLQLDSVWSRPGPHRPGWYRGDSLLPGPRPLAPLYLGLTWGGQEVPGEPPGGQAGGLWPPGLSPHQHQWRSWRLSAEAGE